MTQFLSAIAAIAKLQPLAGYRTYLAAAGLVGLAVYQLSQGEFDKAPNSLLAALALVGIRAKFDEPTPPNAAPAAAAVPPANEAVAQAA